MAPGTDDTSLDMATQLEAFLTSMPGFLVLPFPF